MLDKTDLDIINYLKKDGRMKWNDLGDLVHLTGQAVSNRVKELEKKGIIEGYTVSVNEQKLGHTINAYITVFMKSLNHSEFVDFIRVTDEIKEAHRISGEGCYMLKVSSSSNETLVQLIDSLLKFGLYKINMSIDVIK